MSPNIRESGSQFPVNTLKFFRACALAIALCVLGMPGPAAGATMAASYSGYVEYSSSIVNQSFVIPNTSSPDPNLKLSPSAPIPAVGVGGADLILEGRGNFGLDKIPQIGADVLVNAYNEEQNALAKAGGAFSVVISDQITPRSGQFIGGVPVLNNDRDGHQILESFVLDIHGYAGALVAPHSEPGINFATAHIQYDVFVNGTRLSPLDPTVSMSEDSDSSTGQVGTRLTKGHIVFGTLVTAGVDYTMSLRVNANARAQAYSSDSGAYQSIGEAQFNNTLSWLGLSEAFDLTTNEPIPLDEFFLIGSDGYDWVHPVPEPMAICWIAPLAILLHWARRDKGLVSGLTARGSA